MNIPEILKYVYIANISFILLHEMDAIYWKEWRLFGFRNDNQGLKVFILAHIPLLFIILMGLITMDILFGKIVSICLSAFFILHFVLHIKALSEKFFNNFFSFGIITSITAISIGQLILSLLSLL